MGRTHVVAISGSYLIPDVPTKILSPQHLAQQANYHHLHQQGTGALTMSKSITLFWGQRRFQKMVLLDSWLNVGIPTMVCGYKLFRSLLAMTN